MGRKYNSVRAFGGMLAIVTLMGLFIADFYFTGRTLRTHTVDNLMIVIGSLLAVDIGLKSIPVTIEVDTKWFDVTFEKEYSEQNDNTTDEDKDDKH